MSGFTRRAAMALALALVAASCSEPASNGAAAPAASAEVAGSEEDQAGALTRRFDADVALLQEHMSLDTELAVGPPTMASERLAALADEMAAYVGAPEFEDIAIAYRNSSTALALLLTRQFRAEDVVALIDVHVRMSAEFRDAWMRESAAVGDG